MLRRKLLIVSGGLVILLAVMAGSAIWLLQGILHRLDHVNAEASRLVAQVYQLNQTISAVQIDLYQLQLGNSRHLDTLIDDVETARGLLEVINRHYVVLNPQLRPYYE